MKKQYDVVVVGKGALWRHLREPRLHSFQNVDLSLRSAPNDPIQYPPIPFAVFSHPQIGVIGKTEQELKQEGLDLVCGRAEYMKSDMGRARRLHFGIVKLIFDKNTRRLLSAHIAGDEAATMIHILSAYIQMKATVEDLVQTIFIHPALKEVVSSAAKQREKEILSLG